MKKIITIFLVLAMTVSLFVGCKKTETKPANDKPQTSSNDKPQTNTPTEKDEPSTIEDDPEETGAPVIDDSVIRPNGELPDGIGQLTSAEIEYYFKDIFYAVRDFDFEKLESYYPDGKFADLHAIYDNEEYRALWEKTIGQIIYLPKAKLMVSRSPAYAFSMWYTDAASKNAEIPENVGELPHDEVNAIYEQYFTNAPYIAAQLDYFAIDFDVKDGRIVFTINEIFENLGFAEISDMSPRNYQDGYGRMVMGDENYLGLGYDYIKKETNCPYYEEVMTLDLDKIFAVLDEEEFKKESDFYYQNYELYYKNDEYRPIIQDWIKENCIALRALSNVRVFMKVDPSKEWPYYLAEGEEQEQLQKLECYTMEYVREFPHDLGNTYSLFFDVIETMVFAEKLPKLY